jgi:hypothetical protein
MSASRDPRPRTRALAGIRRALHRANARAVLFSGWTWIAAGSLIGFEAFDLVFGAVALAPELLPLLLIALALTWLFRERLRRTWARLRARRRLRRLRSRG